MPNGNVHYPVALTVAAVTTVAAYQMPTVVLHPLSGSLALGVSAGVWLAIYAGPDRDHFKHTVDEQAIWRKSRILGRLNEWYWRDYVASHGHRGNGSHTWPWGTWERFWYLMLLPLAASGLLAMWLGWSLAEWFAVWAGVFAGMSINDCVHIALDAVWDRLPRWAKE